jgi:hypothetical protein
MGVDPIAGDEALEQRPVEIAGDAVVDILDGGLMPQLGVSQPCGQTLVVAIAALAVEQQAEAFGDGKRRGVAGGQDLGEGLRIVSACRSR